MAAKTLGKGDLIESVAKAADLSKSNASSAVNAVIDTISASLKKGNAVTITGFGSFSVSKRKARNGRNPQTGETIKIKASKVAKFKPGKALKDAVAGRKR